MRIQLPTLGFGGAPLGNMFKAVPDDQAQATLEAAWQAGIRYYDTSPHYGAGRSETVSYTHLTLPTTPYV